MRFPASGERVVGLGLLPKALAYHGLPLLGDHKVLKERQ